MAKTRYFAPNMCLLVSTSKTVFNDTKNGYKGGKEVCDIKVLTASKSFPTILIILKISNTLAPGSVDCERAFLKTKLRNRLTV